MTYRVPVPGGVVEIPRLESLAGWDYWNSVFAKRPEASWGNMTESFARILDRFEKRGVRSLWEGCGGLGVFSKMAQDRLDLDAHDVVDVAPEAIEVVRVTAPAARGIVGNAAAVEIPAEYDAAFVDYPKFTLYRVASREDSWEVSVFERLVEDVRPRLLAVTDSARSKLHLNRDLYSERFGVEIETVVDYYQVYRRLAPGYRIDLVSQFATIGGGATHLVLLREGP